MSCQLLGLMILSMALAGCTASMEEPIATGTPVTQPAPCAGTYPDGSPHVCRQGASPLIEADPRGTVCSDQSFPGPQGTIQLRRHPVSGEVHLVLDLAQDGTSGIAWVLGKPETMWYWRAADVDTSWTLGVLEQGTQLRILAYTFAIEETNQSTPTTLEQYWSPYDGYAYALHRVVADGREYFFDRMVAVDRGGHTTYEMASFNAYAGPFLFEARHSRVISVDLTVREGSSCPLAGLV